MFKKINELINKLIKIDVKKLYYKRYHFIVHLKDGSEIKVVTENITLNEFDDILCEMNKNGFIGIDNIFFKKENIDKIELIKTDIFEWYDIGGITNLPPITTKLEILNKNNEKYKNIYKEN